MSSFSTRIATAATIPTNRRAFQAQGEYFRRYDDTGVQATGFRRPSGNPPPGDRTRGNRPQGDRPATAAGTPPRRRTGPGDTVRYAVAALFAPDQPHLRLPARTLTETSLALLFGRSGPLADSAAPPTQAVDLFLYGALRTGQPRRHSPGRRPGRVTRRCWRNSTATPVLPVPAGVPRPRRRAFLAPYRGELIRAGGPTRQSGYRSASLAGEPQRHNDTAV